MSLTLRRDALNSRQHDLKQTRRAHRSQAGALRAITRLIAKNNTLNDLINTQRDAENSPPPDSDEATWLKALDLDSGHTFDEASIPFPATTTSDEAAIRTKPNRPSPQPAGLSGSARNGDAPGSEATATSPDDLTAFVQSSPVDGVSKRPRGTSHDGQGQDHPPNYVQRASRKPDGPVAVPDEIAPPQPDEEAEFDEATKDLLDLESPERPAKVIHLPTEEEQAEAEDSRRRSDDSDPMKPSRTHLHAQGEGASSPSSTVGAYSAATPMPPQESPDTSPDSEHGERLEVLPPKDLRPSPEEQRQKEEHDRLLEAQKEIARKQALGDVSETPDEQLRWEEREAAARTAEEQAARDDGGPEPQTRLAGAVTEAEEVVDDVMKDRESERAETSVSVSKAKAPEEIRSKAQRVAPSTIDEEDGDNIIVTPRNRAPLTIDTSRQSQPAPTQATIQDTTSEQERMTTRTSSGVLHKRTVSEIMAQTPSQPGPSRGSMVLSPDTLSPTATRIAQELAGPSTTYATPRQPPKRPDLPRTPSHSKSALEDLMALKCAAQDPDRDYLEPLFRIQAHDTGNGRTTSLSELVRSASKTLSTEDQVMTMQERLDYKILRRIYHLQNANKWSLRQMERCLEPEQPVTHHDHMMAEMKWMRRDFKGERKMKTSVCAWLATRCAEWVAASAQERKAIQVNVRPPRQTAQQTDESGEQPPELEHAGELSAEEDAGPPTPTETTRFPRTLVVPLELSEVVTDLKKAGKLQKALETLPTTGFTAKPVQQDKRSLSAVSKFVHGNVLPQPHGPNRKRSRYAYDDDDVLLANEQPNAKRRRAEADLLPEDQDSALFHPDNKPIRDRLHANNAFRPPSEFPMPSIQFYEFRSGSQWIWEDDQKLKKLAKEYSFNWSLIADELQLPGYVKSSAERRTPWECFERWVELEQLPTEMKKTMYFKTWFQRLETSSQASERRYQAHVAAIQAQNSGQAPNVPPRKRTVPSRVEKRRNTRYLWLVDAMRKGARKKEQSAYKAAEASRAAAQRKNQADPNQPRAQILTPQQFSQKRHERDVHENNMRAQQAAKLAEHQRRLLLQRQQAQQAQQGGGQNGVPNQQRPGSSSNASMQAQMQPNAQGQPQQVGANGQMQQPGRPQLPMATRNGHLAVPQVGAQGIPQAQMRPNGTMQSAQDMQRYAQANAQARNGQYSAQQQYQMQNASMQSPGTGGMTTQQQMHSNNAMLAQLQQQQMNGNGQHQPSQHANHQMSASPSMPPPPTPQQAHSLPQTLSSGHVPALINIKAQIRARNPTMTEDELNQMATQMLTKQSQSTNQARQSAMNAAAGINGTSVPQAQAHNANLQAYAQNQASYNQNANAATTMANGKVYNNNNAMVHPSDPNALQAQGSAQARSTQQANYAAMIHRAQAEQMRMQPSPTGGHANLASPSLTHASPNMVHASPSLVHATPGSPYGTPGQMAVAGMGMQRPPSRSASGTPGVPQRLGSSGGEGSPGPGMHGQGHGSSPTGVQAGGRV